MEPKIGSNRNTSVLCSIHCVPSLTWTPHNYLSSFSELFSTRILYFPSLPLRSQHFPSLITIIPYFSPPNHHPLLPTSSTLLPIPFHTLSSLLPLTSTTLHTSSPPLPSNFLPQPFLLPSLLNPPFNFLLLLSLPYFHSPIPFPKSNYKCIIHNFK